MRSQLGRRETLSCDCVSARGIVGVRSTRDDAPFTCSASCCGLDVLGLNLPLVIAVFALPRFHLYLWGALGLGSAAAVVIGIIRNQPTRRSAWVFVALGVTTFALGDISYDVLTKFMHERNPFPSIADVFYLATYLLLSTGLILMVRSRRRRDGDSGAVLDALIFTSGFGALSWIYLIQPYVDADMGILSKLTSVAYPIGDILLLCVLVRLVFGGGTRNSALRLLAVGAIGVFAADCVYGWIQLHGSWRVGGPTDSVGCSSTSAGESRRCIPRCAS